MAYVNTGYQRASNIDIIHTTNGVEDNRISYPVINAIGDGSVYPAITLDALSKLSIADYTARFQALVNYINGLGIYENLVVTADNSRVKNLVSCPLP